MMMAERCYVGLVVDSFVDFLGRKVDQITNMVKKFFVSVDEIDNEDGYNENKELDAQL